MNILALLRDRFAAALTQLGIDATERPALVDMVLSSQDAKFGDYQANCAMPLGKRLGKPPREIAGEIVRLLEVADVCAPPEIAGPGFINLRLRDDWLQEKAAVASRDVERLGIPEVGRPKTIVVDYSSPNVAKPMHVGHIRSTVIGDALYRILKFLGHHTISDNHLGDWGTQFGMIIFGYKHFRNEQNLQQHSVFELSRLYNLVNLLVAYEETRDQKIPTLKKRVTEAEQEKIQLESIQVPDDPKARKAADKRIQQAQKILTELRNELEALEDWVSAFRKTEEILNQHPDIGRKVLVETAALHGADPTNVELWREFMPACLAELNAIYKRLGVTFDHTLGESFYQDRLRGVVKDLADRGLARVSDGAMCVFLEGYDAPMIVQKQDGAFLYATTDLATIQYRVNEWKPDGILYVVDHRQSLHFEQLFATARKWGYKHVELQHIAFGTVLGEDGRPFKTRSGAAIGLTGLLDEAVERARAIVSQNDDERPEPLLSAEERRRVAERVGIGAIKYADLAHNRTSDYVFSYDKMLAMTGNTAAYMQYSYARVKSIFEKAGADESEVRGSQSAILLTTSQERALAVSLLQFAESLDRVVADYRPNHLTAYLFELASRYSDFFEHCPVLRAETDELRTSRLLLCDLTARTLQRGLNLLGIEVVERM